MLCRSCMRMTRLMVCYWWMPATPSTASTVLLLSTMLHTSALPCPWSQPSKFLPSSAPTRLFVTGGGELQSCEGTTQGDPLAMAFYALATLPLLKHLHDTVENVRQVWYADDSGAAGRLQPLRIWWDELARIGPSYGYFPNSAKTQLLVKPAIMEQARTEFNGTGITIKTGGTKYLGSAIGDSQFISSFLAAKIHEWQEEVSRLSTYAAVEPQAAYAVLTNGLRGRWTYLLRTINCGGDALKQLDDVIRSNLLPVLTGHPFFREEEFALLSLPAREGGMGIPHLSYMATTHYTSSLSIVEDQVKEILQQSDSTHQSLSTATVITSIRSKQNKIRSLRRAAERDRKTTTVEALPALQGRLVELASRKGASAWLVAIPLRCHGFFLSKRDFCDAICLRYDWPLTAIPQVCICGTGFNTTHAMICQRGGFPPIRHNEVRDLLGLLLTEVCSNVAVEPPLLPLTGEEFAFRSVNTSQAAQADLRASGFWTRAEDAYFDVRVFHPQASSYLSRDPDDLFAHHEHLKTQEYQARITTIDHGSFCPLVFSTCGGAGPQCNAFIKRLAASLAEHDGKSYSCVLSWLRCRLLCFGP